jgi:hypothetical protein
MRSPAIPWSVFFDDYTAFSPVELETDTTFYAEGLFELLGIFFAAKGSKTPPYLPRFRTLGLIVDAEDALKRTVRVGHSPERSKNCSNALKSLWTTNQ